MQRQFHQQLMTAPIPAVTRLIGEEPAETGDGVVGLDLGPGVAETAVGDAVAGKQRIFAGGVSDGNLFSVSSCTAAKDYCQGDS